MNTNDEIDKTATALAYFTRCLDLARSRHLKIEQVTALFSRNIALAMAMLGGGTLLPHRPVVL